ncbi:MAG: hypothetical protein ACRCYR_17970 [Phycicoccus sp.]
MRSSVRPRRRAVAVVAASVVVALGCLAYPYVRGNTDEQLAGIAPREVADPRPRMVRGEPYHEVLVVYRQLATLRAAVYNDIGKPLIGDEEFARIDTGAVADELGAMTAIKNGPRFWVMDEITGYRAGADRVIAGHPMSQPGVLDLSLSDLANRSPYTGREVHRTTTYTYRKGQRVYELVTDRGEVFAMQSGSREVDAGLALESLDTLGPRLVDLPPGWSYRVRTADRDETYHVDGLARVVQDEFRNSYQQVPS